MRSYNDTAFVKKNNIYKTNPERQKGGNEGGRQWRKEEEAGGGRRRQGTGEERERRKGNRTQGNERRGAPNIVHSSGPGVAGQATKVILPRRQESKSTKKRQGVQVGSRVSSHAAECDMSAWV